MLHSLLMTGALLSLVVPLTVAMDTCRATGIPGIPGIPGQPGRDGRHGGKGEKGHAGGVWAGDLNPLNGETGEPGPVGFMGKRGQRGEAGAAGIQGNPGPPGEAGEAGTIGEVQRAAFSVARGTNDNPTKGRVIRFTNAITNIMDDYKTDTGHFRCRVSGTYFFVYHASQEDRLCVLLKLGETTLASFCDHHTKSRKVSSGGLAVYVAKDQEVWLEAKDYAGMTGRQSGNSIFSGFLQHAH
ncbi:complement C1q subcomponent subunit C-like [Genypterus blacodes]|uniref:complement C1q subcomponent subunit C-like n=1 Tax=Genypterus blacodes TaxID=154954 RepID=UPI003F75E860